MTAALYVVAGHALSLPRLALIGLVPALAFVVPASLWRVGRLGVTAVHETGHAFAAALAGRRVTGVHLRADSSGVTYHQGPRRWLSSVVVAAAGYPAPGLVGLVGAWLTARGDARGWLIGLLVLGLVDLVMWVRNLFGVALLVVWVGAVGWLSVYGARGLDELVGAALAWFLLLGGLRAAGELVRDRAPNDASDLAKLVHLPRGVAKAVLWLATAACAAGGVLLLFGTGWLHSMG